MLSPALALIPVHLWALQARLARMARMARTAQAVRIAQVALQAPVARMARVALQAQVAVEGLIYQSLHFLATQTLPSTPGQLHQMRLDNQNPLPLRLGQNTQVPFQFPTPYIQHPKCQFSLQSTPVPHTLQTQNLSRFLERVQYPCIHRQAVPIPDMSRSLTLSPNH